MASALCPYPPVGIERFENYDGHESTYEEDRWEAKYSPLVNGRLLIAAERVQVRLRCTPPSSSQDGPSSPAVTKPMAARAEMLFDAKMRAEVASPVSLLAGFGAGLLGFAVAGLVIAVVVGALTLIGTAVVVERSLQRTMSKAANA